MRSSAVADHGFTLIELLVVISIFGLVLAISVGGYVAMTRGTQIEGMSARLEAVIRHAHNSTLYERAPAGVFVMDICRAELRDPSEFIEGEVLGEKGKVLFLDVKGRAKAVEVKLARVIRIRRTTRVRSVGFRTVGAWHLERSDSGAGYLGRLCRLEGGEPHRGKIGSGVVLNRSGRGKDRVVALPAPDDSSDPFRLPGGGRIEMWARALPSARDGFLLRRAGSYEIKVRGDGTVEGGVPDDLVEVENYVFPLGRWVKVALAFGPEYVQIEIEGVVRAYLQRKDGTLNPPREGELAFGQFFSGVIDEIRVQRRVEGEAFDLPEDYKLSGPREIIFDARGRLDARVHAGPVTLQLARGDKSVSIKVARNGRIR